MSNDCGRSCWQGTQHRPSGESTIAQVDYSAFRRSASQRAAAHEDRRFMAAQSRHAALVA